MKPHPRTLRSKRLRSLLWQTADGKCRLCGCDLPADWHADHIEPFAVTQRTNFHEMQALCPACNLKKGSSLMQPRQFQSELTTHCDEVIAGARRKTIVTIVTPGGGKSCIPPIVASRFIAAGLADFIAWIVPRVSLAEQAEADFTKHKLFNQRYKIRVSTNEQNPCRGLHGFVTTHQAIAMDSAESVLWEFRKHRGILVIDECHHIYEGSPAHRMLIPIFEAARWRVLMTGSSTRGDGRSTAFMPYKDAGNRLVEIDDQADGYKVIRYTRSQALKEKAKIPISFVHVDGATKWLDPLGDEQSVGSLRDIEEASPAVWSALQTDYSVQLLVACCDDFDQHRRFNNPRAKLLIVCYSIVEARRHLEFIKERWRHFRVGIAVCKDADERDISKESRGAIKRFKQHGGASLDVLITVQMAYEGLDAPSITHLACLTRIRSWPWIEQMLDRGTRYDYEAGPWESQRLKAYVPDDPKMNEAIARIDAEQEGFVREAAKDQEDPGPGPGGGAGTPKTPEDENIIPLCGQVTDTRYSGVIGDEPMTVTAEEGRRLTVLMSECNMIGSPLELKVLLAKYEREKLNPTPVEVLEPVTLADLVPSDEENILRDKINTHCSQIDKYNFGRRFGTTNDIVKKEFGKSRKVMTVPELRMVWAFLNRRFPSREVS